MLWYFFLNCFKTQITDYIVESSFCIWTIQIDLIDTLFYICWHYIVLKIELNKFMTKKDHIVTYDWQRSCKK